MKRANFRFFQNAILKAHYHFECMMQGDFAIGYVHKLEYKKKRDKLFKISLSLIKSFDKNPLDKFLFGFYPLEFSVQEIENIRDYTQYMSKLATGDFTAPFKFFLKDGNYSNEISDLYSYLNEYCKPLAKNSKFDETYKISFFSLAVKKEAVLFHNLSILLDNILNNTDNPLVKHLYGNFDYFIFEKRDEKICIKLRQLV